MIIYLNSSSATATLWLQDKIIVYMHSMAANGKITLKSSSPTVRTIATYTIPISGEIYIDITDYCRTNYDLIFRANFSLLFTDEQTNNSRLLSFLYGGLINPDNVLHPLNVFGQSYILPPKMMYSTNSNAIPIVAEMRGNDRVFGASYDTDLHRLIIRSSFVIQHTAELEETYEPVSIDDCDNYIIIQWRSFTGVIKTHVWKIRKRKFSSVNDYSLQDLSVNLKEYKGRQDEISIYLENLCLYDYWYYSDIITSGLVYARINNVYQRVIVTTKNITIPDGESFDGKLEIGIKLWEWDAIADMDIDMGG